MPEPEDVRTILSVAGGNVGNGDKDEPQEIPINTDYYSSMAMALSEYLDPMNGVGAIFVQDYEHDFHFEHSQELTSRFKIMNNEGRCIFWAGETEDCGSKCWRGMDRRFTFYFYSTDGDLILTVERQRLQTCSKWSCPSEIEKEFNSDLTNKTIMSMLDTYVHLAGGSVIGRIRNVSSACRPQYEVEDDASYNLLNIRSENFGTVCPPFSCRNSTFHLYDRRRKYLGEIRKSVTLMDDKNQKKRCMGAQFPHHLSPLMKALILSAMFELKVTYFQRRLSTVELLWALVVTILLSITLLLFYMTVTFVQKD